MDTFRWFLFTFQTILYVDHLIFDTTSRLFDLYAIDMTEGRLHTCSFVHGWCFFDARLGRLLIQTVCQALLVLLLLLLKGSKLSPVRNHCKISQ